MDFTKAIAAIAKEFRQMNVMQIIAFSFFIIALRLPENIQAVAAMSGAA